MTNLIGLIESICGAYDTQSFKPSNGVTHCNQAANYIAKTMGCNDFEDKMADDIYDFLANNPLDWTEILMQQSQDIANRGSFVVAILDSKSLGQQHGHIVVIRPGITCDSGKWGTVPRCINIGAQNFIAKAPSGPLIGMDVGINESFGPKPRFFVWRPSL